MTALLGSEYGYERVLKDSRGYKQANADGTFSAWWETYLRDKGLDGCYCAFAGLSSLADFGGSIVGMLGMEIPRLRVVHLVAVDEVGVVDPAQAPTPSPISTARVVAAIRSAWLSVEQPTECIWLVRGDPARP